MGVQVSFRLGRYSGKADSKNPKGLDAFRAAMASEVLGRAARAATVDVNKLQRGLDYRVKQSLQSAINHARMNIMGLVSAEDNRSPTQIYFDTIGSEGGSQPAPYGVLHFARSSSSRLRGAAKMEWEPLRASTRRKKMKAGASSRDARRHFVATGALRDDLARLARNITEHTGSVSVGYKLNKDAERFTYQKGLDARGRFRGRRDGDFIKVGEVRITFLPNVPTGRLPGLKTGRPTDVDRKMNFEQNLGLSQESVKKLMGTMPNGVTVNRPLLQPIITFWMLHRTPLIIQKTLTRSIKEL